MASFWNQLHIYLKKIILTSHPNSAPFVCAKVQDLHSEFRAQISPTSTSNKWLPLAKLVVKSATQQNGTKAVYRIGNEVVEARCQKSTKVAEM